MESEKTEFILENYLLRHIPITSAMGVKVEQASSQQIILTAPKMNNINHKKTVFGGSLHAVATLACWSLLHVNLIETFDTEYQIVIASSQISYDFPVSADFKAVCNMPEQVNWERFKTILKKKGKARLELSATIVQDLQLCVSYSFVALRVE